MPKLPITTDMVTSVRGFLGAEGLSVFRNYKNKYGTVSPVIHEKGKIPWSVHFREGMLVRNRLWQSGLCQGWTAHDYDDNWQEVVEQAIKH